MDFILFGIQGSGKGTQGKILAEKFGMALFETGNELRKLAKENSHLGQKVKTIIEAGHLVPNDVVMEIVEHFLASIPKEKSAIFDGIPRKKEQDDSLQKLLAQHNREAKGISFTLTEEQALARLETRRVCENCKTVYPKNYTAETCSACGGTLVKRSDDNETSIRNRFKAFHEETTPIIESYRAAGKLMEINAAEPIEKVTENLLNQTITIFDQPSLNYRNQVGA